MKLEDFLKENSVAVQVSVVKNKDGESVFRVAGNKKVKKQINRTYSRVNASNIPSGTIESKDLIALCESNLEKIKVA